MHSAIDYMLTLDKKYRSIVTPELRELLSSNSNASNTTTKQNNV